MPDKIPEKDAYEMARSTRVRIIDTVSLLLSFENSSEGEGEGDLRSRSALRSFMTGSGRLLGTI